MIYIEAPNEWRSEDRLHMGLFLGGGITGCSDWQSEMVERLEDTELAILNPRRKEWPNDRQEIKRQICWEYLHLRMADARLFWFAPETLCPITLFEYGKWLRSENLFVGVHPAYARKFDVEVQTALESPEIEIHYSLASLADAVKAKYE